MNPREFFINPPDYGLPTRDELVAYRIWDNHFHGFASKNPIEQYERNNFFVERMGIERSIAQEVGGTLEEPFAPYPYDAEILKILERDKDRLSGRTPLVTTSGSPHVRSYSLASRSTKVNVAGRTYGNVTR